MIFLSNICGSDKKKCIYEKPKITFWWYQVLTYLLNNTWTKSSEEKVCRFGLYNWRVCKCVRPGFKFARDRIIFKVWWSLTLHPLIYRFQIFSFERSKLLLIESKVQNASSILRVGFVLSKWPHLHRVYLITVCRFFIMTV